MSTTMPTTTEAAVEIRAAYKKLGWSARQISVRSEYYSLGSSIDITIKDGQIPFPLAKSIAEGKEHIRRCEITGEILGGSNRYVSVRVSPEAVTLKARRYIDATERAISLLDPTSDNELREIVPGYHVGRGVNGYGYSLWGDSHIQVCTDAAGIAYALAIEIEKTA